MLQGLFGGLINPQTSGLVQQMFRGADRGRAFGVLGTTVGLGTAIGPLVGGALIALGGPTLGWRLVFFVNIPVGLVVHRPVAAAPARADRDHPPPARRARRRPARRGDVLRPVRLRGVRRAPRRPARLAGRAGRGPARALPAPGAAADPESRDPLVDLRLFRRPSYVSGITLALAFFPAMAGLPLVLALYYQRGLGYTALESALGVTAYAVGSAVSAPLAGRVVTRIGRPLVVAGAVTFGVGAIAMARRRHARPRRARDARAGAAAVRDGLRPGHADHAQPDAGADGRRPADGQHRRWRAPDRPADRPRDRSGR